MKQTNVQPLQEKNFFRLNFSIYMLFSFFIYLSPLQWQSEVFAASPSSQETQQQLKQLREEIKSLKAALQEQVVEKGSLQQRLKQAELEIAETARSIYDTQAQMTKLNANISQLNGSLQQLTIQLQRQQELLASQLRASYAIGRQEYLKLLLNQQDPATFSRILTYYNYFNQARSKKIDHVKQLMQKISVQKQQLAATQLQLKQQLTQLNNDKLTLEHQQQHRTDVLNQLESEIQTADEKLQTLKDNENNLLQLIKKLEQALIDIANLPTEQPFAGQKGKMYWPAKGKIKKLYGRWRSVDKVKWQGVIINAREGTPVYSVSHGRIAYADWLRGYGLLTIIDHGDGYMSLYGHNQTLLKEEGDWVKTGEVIATIGNSGGLSTSGLYFELRQNGKATNPTRWCKKQRR